MNDLSIYDVCFLSISNIKSDARTINIARVLAKQGKRISIIAFGEEQDKINLKAEGIELFIVKPTTTDRAFKKWLHFKKHVKIKFNIKAKTYWASDFFTLSSALRLAKINNAKLFYDSREIYSMVASLSNSRIKQFIQTQLELQWVKHVDKIIVSGELDEEYLRKHFNINVPFFVLMNLPPYKGRMEQNLFRENFNIRKEDKIILYQGMLMKGRGILPIVRALKYLENVCFCLLGTGNYSDEIKQEAEMNGVGSKVFLCGNVDYDELHKWTCSADIGNCFIEPISFGNNLALPNKLFEYCLAGIPSIVSDLPAMKKIIEEHNFGKLLPANSTPEEIAKAIKELLIDKNYLNYRESCVKAAKVFCYENQESIIERIFNI